MGLVTESVGAVLSTFTEYEAFPVLPAKSLQVAVTEIAGPWPDETVLVLQLARSIPDPPALSVQFQVTVTSVVFQPAPLAGGA